MPVTADPGLGRPAVGSRREDVDRCWQPLTSEPASGMTSIRIGWARDDPDRGLCLLLAGRIDDRRP